MKCPACGSEERDGALYCGMCKQVFGKPPPSARPAAPLADPGWIRPDGAKGPLDAATYGSVRAICGPARVAAEAGKLDEANAQYERALALLPGNPLKWDAGSCINAAIGENHLRAGRYELARKHLAAAVDGHNGKQTPMFRWLFGEAETELGALDSAIDHLRIARDLIGREHLARRHPKYLGLADGTPSMSLLADPPRPSEPAIHASWHARPMANGTGRPAKILFVVYADYRSAWPAIRSRYRVPATLGMRVFERAHELFTQWYAPPVDVLLRHNIEAAAIVQRAPACVIVSGDLPDDGTLLGQRRAIALVSAALPPSGGAIYDPAALRWWSQTQWHAAFADGNALEPRHHVRASRRERDVLTGGLRKFGRPDLVMRDVTPERDQVASALLDMLVASLVAGATLASGPIEVAGQRLKAIAHLADADLDNPYVENTWIELVAAT